MKANYSAWSINPNEFSGDWSDAKKLTFFARYAVLAPSGHNTQPWRFTTKGQHLLLKADYNRRLPYSGAQANEPYVSLGACLGTLQLAAKGFGYKVDIAYALQDATVASVRITGKTTPDASLLTAIVQRVSNRNYYTADPLPEALVARIAKPDLKQVSTQLVSSGKDIAYIADLTTKATLTTFADAGFRAELSKWVRNNATRQRDGMPGFVQGIPMPVSMFAKHVIKRLDVSKDQAKKDSNRVLHSGGLVIVTILSTSEAALMDGGREYARICILAQQQHIATAGVGAAIIDPETTKEVVRKFHLPGKPVAIIRLGKATKPAKHTPRWPLAQVTD